MKEKLKNIGWGVLGFLIFVGFILIIALFIKGGVWLSAKLYPWLLVIMAWTMVIAFVILLPLSIFKKNRGVVGLGMTIASYVFGGTLWIWGFLLTYSLWGGAALLIGLILIGVGVVPIAMLATIFKGMWSTLGQLVLLLVLTFGTRALGIYLVAKHEEQKTVGTFIPEKGKKSGGKKERMFFKLIHKLPHWVRWILVLPAAFIGDMAAQSYGLILATMSGLKGPYANAFIWYTFAPLIWLAAGVKLAPVHRSLAGAVLAAIKVGVLVYNSYSAIDFLNKGGSWDSIYPVTDAPLWWHLVTYILGIIALIVSYVVIYNSEQRKIQMTHGIDKHEPETLGRLSR